MMAKRLLKSCKPIRSMSWPSTTTEEPGWGSTILVGHHMGDGGAFGGVKMGTGGGGGGRGLAKLETRQNRIPQPEAVGE